jgi:hypothetical protein
VLQNLWPSPLLRQLGQLIEDLMGLTSSVLLT